MADQIPDFVDGDLNLANRIKAAWLNDVNDAVYRFTQSGTGAVARGIQDKNRDIVSVKDFGAVGDGVTNDAAAIQAALTACAVNGASLYIPDPLPYATYYMGTTGVTQSGSVKVFGGGGLEWSSAFTGTAWTITGSYNTIDGITLWMPKSVAAPNAAIIGIDVQGPLNALRGVILDQTSAGNHSPWYTGVKIGDISNSLHECHVYAYDKGVTSYGSVRNDVSIIDCEITAEITAAIHLPQTGTVSIVGCDIEGSGGGLYGIWLEAVSAEIAGALIEGNYIQTFTGSGIWVNGIVGNTAKGVTIIGNTINQAAATNAVKASYTEGLVCIGNYIKGGTNWLNLDTSNLRYQITPNYTSGALASSGVTTPAVASREASTALALTLNAFTIVNGTGAVTVAGTYRRLGGEVLYNIRISTTGTATIASVANTSNISGLPYATSAYASCPIVDDVVVSLGNGLIVNSDSKIFTPVWAANANEILISGSYPTSAAGTND